MVKCSCGTSKIRCDLHSAPNPSRFYKRNTKDETKVLLGVISTALGYLSAETVKKAIETHICG